MDLDRLHRELGDSVLERMKGLSLHLDEQETNDPSSAIMRLVDQVSSELHEKLLLRNENTKQLIIESIYRESEESTHNIRVWSQAPDVFSARPHIRKVIGSRLSQKFLDMRRAGHAGKAWHPVPRIVPAASSIPTTPPPSRNMVQDFQAFEANPGLRMQMSGTLHQARFNDQSYRTSSMDMDDDDDGDGYGDDAFMADDDLQASEAAADNEIRFEGDDGQTLAFRHDAISWSQARRLAMQSLSRAS